MVCFSLALRLKQPVHEVGSWPLEEIRDWCAFFEIMEDRKSK